MVYMLEVLSCVLTSPLDPIQGKHGRMKPNHEATLLDNAGEWHHEIFEVGHRERLITHNRPC
jgi:hypothetical protein